MASHGSATVGRHTFGLLTNVIGCVTIMGLIAVMLLRTVQLLIFVIVYIQVVQARGDILSVLEKRQNRYCGRNLVDALRLICNGVYNPMFKKSVYNSYRSSLDKMEKDWMGAYNKDDNDIMTDRTSNLFKRRENAMIFMPGTIERRSEGVHEECCLKSCSVHELASYCGKR